MALVLLVVSCGTAYGQQRPLRTDDAELLPVGRVRLELGAEFLQRQRYSLSGLEGDLTRGVAAIGVGVGEYAEFQISSVFQEVLSISRRNEPVVAPELHGDSTRSVGDLVLGTKLKLVGEKGRRPAISFKFAVELPNANQAHGLGNDETGFYADLLFGKDLGRVRLLGDVGFAILGSPVIAGRQADPLTYGLAVLAPVHRRVNLVAEVNGRKGPSGRVGNENRSQFRAGAQIRTGAIRWDVGAVAGLEHHDPKSGIVIGATYEFQAFKRPEAPVKLRPPASGQAGQR
ncbi:MAG: hypothetical protein LBT74_03995 [Acidobacteriota bacterium]|jgi:hypothetical protein|nr:hypothetical protein [Acidobacteriota bacterium]